MNTQEKLFSFIKSSPSPFHAIDTVARRLDSEGFTRIYENDDTAFEQGRGYYVIRNGSSLIAFRYSRGGYMICASHSDSPFFKAKSVSADQTYVRLLTERSGGMIMYSWFDRPLSLAGRVLLRTDGGIRSENLDLDSDYFVIPSLAIHQNPEVNNSFKPNPAVDLLPITSRGAALNALLAEKLGAPETDIISSDLYLYVRDEGRTIGDEYILAPRLDDLECVYASTEAFLAADATDSVPVLAIFDNEENGSKTKQGADSDFLYMTLLRIAGDMSSYRARLADSFLVSADNAHARHPAHPELSDKDFSPVMNGGVVIKKSASQSYATDGMSEAVFTEICRRAGVKTQLFHNRADLRGGTTLGPIADTAVSVPTVDIGLAQLAMHSAVETAGAHDVDEMIRALTAFYSTSLEVRGESITIK